MIIHNGNFSRGKKVLLNYLAEKKKENIPSTQHNTLVRNRPTPLSRRINNKNNLNGF